MVRAHGRRAGLSDVEEITSESVTTEQADITNETFIVPVRNAESGSITAGTWTNVFTASVADNRGEFNGNSQFVPDDGGWYSIMADIPLLTGSSNDRIRARLRNVSDGVSVGSGGASDTENRGRTLAAGSDVINLTFTLAFELTAGKAYEIQAQNVDSAYELRADDGIRCVIRRSVVHP